MPHIEARSNVPYWGKVLSTLWIIIHPRQQLVTNWYGTLLWELRPKAYGCALFRIEYLIEVKSSVTYWSKVKSGGVDINLLWKCQSDISPDRAQSQINLITKRKSSWDFIIYSRANPTFPIVKYRSFLFLFLLPIHYNVNKGCGTTVNDMVLPLFPFTCVYILFLCTLWPYVRLAFPKFVVTYPPNP